jgi:hypothetical protein
MTNGYGNGLSFWRYYANGTNAGPAVWFGDNGNVGIGTTSPSSLLHVSGPSPTILLRSTGTGFRGLWTTVDDASGAVVFDSSYNNTSAYPFSFKIGGGEVVRFGTTGTVAIGKTYQAVSRIGPLNNAPLYFYINTKLPFIDQPAPQLVITGYNYSAPNKAVKLTLGWYVYNNAFYWTQYKNDLGYYNPSRIRLGTYNDNGTIRIRIEIANDGTYWSSYWISAVDHNGLTANYDGWSYAEGALPSDTTNVVTVGEYAGIVYSNTGNVGIGTTNPTQKLSVKGTVRAQEVIVDTGWSDFVFDESYKLKALSETEAFVKSEKHLPGIPSAKEVAENGISVGEMQAKLLAKIEELTLHQIAQEKKLQAQDEKIAAQADAIRTLAAANERLSAALAK